MLNRDKFLTEAMGDCWHESTDDMFSTWEGFGRLWEWATKQKLWISFAHSFFLCERNIYNGFDKVNPNTFANELYKFLKEQNYAKI